METIKHIGILSLAIVFFLLLFVYYYRERFYSIENFSNELDANAIDAKALIPIKTDNTTLDYYKNRWSNSALIAKEINDPFHESGVIYEMSPTTELTKDNFDWKQYYESVKDGFAIHNIPKSLDTCWDHYIRYGKNENRPKKKFFNLNLKSIRSYSMSYWIYLDQISTVGQKIIHYSDRSIDTKIDDPNSYPPYLGVYLGGWVSSMILHQKTPRDHYSGIKGKGTDYWWKVIEEFKLNLNRPYFCTIVFNQNKTMFYMDGKLVFQHSHRALPVELNKNKQDQVLIVGSQTIDNHYNWYKYIPKVSGRQSYVLKDVQFYQDPLNGLQVERLYNESKMNGTIEDASNAVKALNEGFQCMNNNMMNNYRIEGFETISDEITVSVPNQIRTQSGNYFNYFRYKPSSFRYETDDAIASTNTNNVDSLMDMIQAQVETSNNTDSIFQRLDTKDIVNDITIDGGLFKISNNIKIKYYDFANYDYNIPLHNYNDRVIFDGTAASTCFWVRIVDNKKSTTNNKWRVLLQFKLGPQKVFGIYSWGYQLYFIINTPTFTNAKMTYIDSTLSKDWSHIAWTMSSPNDEGLSKWSLYINGVLNHTKDDGYAPPSNTDDYNYRQMIGSNIDNNNLTHLQIGDLRIYQEELSQDQIHAIIKSTAIEPGTESNTYKVPEVFQVKGYKHTREEADTICRNNGATLATTKQLENAQQNGADWCSTGWVADTDEDGQDRAKYPINTRTIQGCGNGRTGIMTWTPPYKKAAVNCYGIKPTNGKNGDKNNHIHMWSETRWSRFD